MSENKKIQIEVALGKDLIPDSIKWHADDLDTKEAIACKAMMLSFWDHTRKDTMKLDLWTRDMTIDEMKIFFHQTLVSMAESLRKATADERISGDMQDFCDYFAERLEIKS